MRFIFFIPYFMKSKDHHVTHGLLKNKAAGDQQQEHETEENIPLPEERSSGDYKPLHDPQTRTSEGNDYYGLAEDERNEMEENKGSE